MDCSPPGSSVHGILQARILEWVAISFSRGSSQPRNRTQVSGIAGYVCLRLLHKKYVTPLLTQARGHSFCPLLMSMSEAFSIFYTLIKLYYIKALSNQDSSLAPDWILLLWRRRIPASFLVQQQPFNSIFSMCCFYCLVTKVCLIHLWRHGPWPARLLCHGIFQVRRLEWVVISLGSS